MQKCGFCEEKNLPFVFLFFLNMGKRLRASATQTSSGIFGVQVSKIRRHAGGRSVSLQVSLAEGAAAKFA